MPKDRFNLQLFSHLAMESMIMSVERQAVLARMRSGDLTLSNAEVL